MIKTNHNKLVYTKGKTSLLKRIEIEFQKGSTSITTTISNKDTQNLGGVIQRADRMDGRLEHQNYDTASPTTPKQFPNG